MTVGIWLLFSGVRFLFKFDPPARMAGDSSPTDANPLRIVVRTNVLQITLFSVSAELQVTGAGALVRSAIRLAEVCRGNRYYHAIYQRL